MKRKTSAVPKRKRGPNGCQDTINQRLRQDIWKGACPPGSRLPTHAELRKLYHASPCTVQNALDKLIKDGFAIANGPKGTFVTDNPPCLSNYAIVYPDHLHNNSHISFWRVLANLANSGRYGPDRKFSLYFGLNGHTDEPDYGKLLKDIQGTRLAGVIFTSNPFMISQTPLFKEIISMRELPKTGFMSESTYPEIPAIYNNYDEGLRKSLEHLRDMRCRRLAVLTISGDINTLNQNHTDSKFIAQAESFGMSMKPWWIQGVHQNAPGCARKLMRLLLDARREERPDAIIITDDSLVEDATQGIADAGLTSPEDINVVAFCNFPEPPPTAVPVKFFGLNVETFLDTCLESLDSQRAGKKVRPLTILPAEAGETTVEKSQSIKVSKYQSNFSGTIVQ